MNHRNWFISHKSKVAELGKLHLKLSENYLQEHLRPFIYRNDLFLSTEECLTLKNNTYLNDILPFGKMDQIPSDGMVCTSTTYQNRFQNEVLTALSYISSVHDIKELFTALIRCFVPISPVNEHQKLREYGSGKSCHWLKGAIFLSLPENHPHAALELSLNIVHELGHQALMIYQDADPIIKNLNQPVYSAIRKTNRPAIMSFHALVAIHFMLYFFTKLVNEHSHRFNTEEINYLQDKIKTLKSDFAQGSYSLRHIDFSNLGISMMAEMITHFEQIGIVA
jgi:HEXXH motif-containing protein